MSLDRIVCPGCGVANTHAPHCFSPACDLLRCLSCRTMWTKRPPARVGISLMEKR